jgi:hypothetical protein
MYLPAGFTGATPVEIDFLQGMITTVSTNETVIVPVFRRIIFRSAFLLLNRARLKHRYFPAVLTWEPHLLRRGGARYKI